MPGVIVARAEIDYRRAAKHGDLLSINFGVAAIGRTSFTYEYEILDQSGALIATAKTVIVRFDYAAGRPVPISEELKQALTRDVRLFQGQGADGKSFNTESAPVLFFSVASGLLRVQTRRR